MLTMHMSTCFFFGFAIVCDVQHNSARRRIFDKLRPEKNTTSEEVESCKKVVIPVPGVFLTEDEYNFDIALRRFKKQVEKAGILSEMKKRQHYEKPSVMRKKKKAAARKRLLKKMRKINMG